VVLRTIFAAQCAEYETGSCEATFRLLNLRGVQEFRYFQYQVGARPRRPS